MVAHEITVSTSQLGKLCAWNNQQTNINIIESIESWLKLLITKNKYLIMNISQYACTITAVTREQF